MTSDHKLRIPVTVLPSRSTAAFPNLLCPSTRSWNRRKSSENSSTRNSPKCCTARTEPSSTTRPWSRGWLSSEGRLLSRVRPSTSTGCTTTAAWPCSCPSSSRWGPSSPNASWGSSVWWTTSRTWRRRQRAWPSCWRSSGSSSKTSFCCRTLKRCQGKRRVLSFKEWCVKKIDESCFYIMY